MPKSLLIFRFCKLYINISTFNYILISLLEIKLFTKWVLLFLDECTFQERESNSPKFWGGLLIKGGSDRFIIFWGAKVKRVEVNISGWGWYPGGHYVLVHMEITIMMYHRCFQLSIKAFLQVIIVFADLYILKIYLNSIKR